MRSSESASGDPPLRLRLHLGMIGAASAVGVAIALVASSPAAVETLYSQHLGFLASQSLTWVSARVPFSLAEWVEASTILLILLFVGRLLIQVLRGQRRSRNALASGALWVSSSAAILLALFYVLWGLHYARAPAAERLGWESPGLGQALTRPEAIAVLAEQLVTAVNRRYLVLHGSPDGGSTTGSELRVDRVDDATDQGWQRAAGSLGLHPTVAVRRGPPKPLLSSRLFTFLGISGFYFPFTGEANFNTLPPGWQQPHTIAHEKAHQRGIASEDEANFYGFVACIHSGDPLVEYSGYLFAQRQLLRVLLRTDPERATELIASRLPGVQRDVDAAYAFWRGYQGPASDLGHAVNDAYLKLNRVEGGTLSYGRSARLLVGLARAWGGRLELEEPSDP